MTRNQTSAAPSLPEELLQSLRMWQESRVLLTAIELDVFTEVGTGATSQEVARRGELDPRAADILLHAVASLGLLEKRGESFFNAPLAQRHLCADSPHDLRAALGHLARQWARWTHLTDVVRTGQPAPNPPAHGWDDASFVAAMHMNAATQAPRLAAALDLSAARRALDLGGGSGAHAIALAQAFPALGVEILDTPEIVPFTRRHVAESGLTDRVVAREGDLRTDAFGEGYDLVLLSSVCHIFGAKENADLIHRAARALAPGGRLVVQDFMLEPDRTAPRAAALFAVNMLVNTPARTQYTEDEYRVWMLDAGLVEVSRVGLDAPTAALVGRRP